MDECVDNIEHTRGRRRAACDQETETARRVFLTGPFVFTCQDPLVASRVGPRMATHPAEPVGGGGKRYRRFIMLG